MAQSEFNFKPFIVVGLLIGPAVISIISLLVNRADDYGAMAGFALLGGSVLSGVALGAWFAYHKKGKGMTVAKRLTLAFLVGLGCACLSFALGVGGCSVTFPLLRG